MFLIITRNFPPDIGGIENVVGQLSEEMSLRGNSVYVLSTTNDKKRVGVEKLSDFLRVERIPAFSPKGAYHFPIGLRRRMRQIRGDFDIIHAHGYHSFPGLVAYANRGSTPFVFSCHYHRKSHKFFRNMLLIPYRKIAKRMVNGSDCVFCVSKAEKELVIHDFSPKKCEVLHNGVSIEEVDSSIGKRQESLVMIGRLERYKNHHIAIESLTKIPTICLDIIGDGPEYSRLEKMVISNGLETRVKFHRGVTEKKKMKILTRSSALLTLSDHESFGLVILEAASVGTSVIASKIPSHEEISAKLETGVTLVNTNSIEEITQAISDYQSGKFVKQN